MNAPSAIRNQRAEGVLHLLWPDGRDLSLGHARLRAACPCAQCRAARLHGHIELVNEGVRLSSIKAQGYGVQLLFDDGHGRGIYPWDYLLTLVEPNWTARSLPG
ncbi:MAG: gamma-butyrobetaine hydroxylase-like domain-containing protein [Pseudomonadota bacterium]